MNGEAEKIEPGMKSMPQAIKILVVEDDKSLGLFLLKVVSAYGLAGDLAISGGEAKLRLLLTDYDIILLDIDAADCNGLDLISLFRERLPDAEIITMTDDNPRWLEAKARELKVAYHMVKPFAVAEFVAILLHIIQRKINKVF